MGDTFKKFRDAKTSVSKSDGFNCKVHPLVEFLEYRDQMESQITYISENVSEYEKIKNGTLAEYFFAISKFLLKNQKPEKNVRNIS